MEGGGWTTSTMGNTANGMLLTSAVRSSRCHKSAKQVIGKAEGSKSTRQIIAPISGTVVEVNTELEADPDLINKSPERTGWMIKIDSPSAFVEGLMDQGRSQWNDGTH